MKPFASASISLVSPTIRAKIHLRSSRAVIVQGPEGWPDGHIHEQVRCHGGSTTVFNWPEVTSCYEKNNKRPVSKFFLTHLQRDVSSFACSPVFAFEASFHM